MRVFGFVVVLAVMSACGLPKDGTSCGPSEDGVAICAGTTDAAWCDRGFWFTFSCPGPRGCFKNGDQTLCDFTGTPIGNPCPLRAVGSGYCRDSTKMLKCTADPDGAHFSPVTCSSCTQDGDLATCRP